MNPERKGKGVRFERIRRITGYLVGTLDRWNNAKKAEGKDRVKHGIVKVETNFYDKEEIFPDCTVKVLTNTATGEVSVGWWKNG